MKEIEQAPTISKIEIVWVDFDIETPFRISHENFLSYFNKNLKRIEIIDTKQISSISISLNNIFSTQNVEKKLDTRFQIRIYYSNKKYDDLYGNEAYIQKSDKIYINNFDIQKFLH